MSTNEIKPGDTQVINLEDVDVSAIESSKRLAPPPLPPEAASPSMVPSMPPPAPAPKRGAGFYVALLVGFVVIGVAGGIVAAKALRKPEAATPSPGVITIPTVEMDDAPDAGP